MKVALKLIFSFHQQKELRDFPWDVFFFQAVGGVSRWLVTSISGLWNLFVLCSNWL
jgi:hypothetical protein